MIALIDLAELWISLAWRGQIVAVVLAFIGCCVLAGWADSR